MAMPVGTWDDGEFGAFPAFLSRPKVEVAANDDIASNHAPRRLSDWLRGLSRGSVVARIARENIMRNGRDDMQETPQSFGRPGVAGAKVQQPITAQPDNVLLSQVTQAVEAFRKIEGERMLAQMLESLLGRSHGVLQAHGIQAGTQQNDMVRKMREHIDALNDEVRQLRFALENSEGRNDPAA